MATPLSLIPVNLKESALDSPSFRANVVHFCEQVDTVERWLEGYIRSMLKVCQEIGGLEEALAASFTQSIPSLVSESILDHDYSLLAIELFTEAGRDFWSIAIAYSKRMQPQMIEPLSEFLRNDVRQFKECRRAFEASQQRYDVLLQRYAGQSKGKEASALREDAFQLHESRKAYIRSSFDFCVKAPELRASLDRVITRVTTDLWREQVRHRKGFSLGMDRYDSTMDRIRSWSDAMENSAKIFKQELILARKDMEEQARHVTKPSRELEDYSSSTVPFLTARGKESAGSTFQDSEAIEKQGWLFIRSVTGKQGTRSTWVRRWCFVKDGIFGSLVLQGQGSKGSGVEETEKIGLLLCNIKPAFQEDRRFCFEIKTKDNSIILQAETQQELTSWLSVFEAAKRAAVLFSSGTNTSASAFSISPPSTEFASPQMLRTDEVDRSSTLNVLTYEAGSRASAELGKRVPTVGDEIAFGSQTSRLGQIIDVPSRKSTGHSYGQPGSGDRKSLPGGIQALISASHGALPQNVMAPTASTVTLSSAPTVVTQAKNPILPDARTSLSLAPRTLVSLPMATSLSKQAVAVSAVSVRTVTLPGGLIANSWGTSNWGLSGRNDELASKLSDAGTTKDKITPLPSGQPPPDSGTNHGHRKAISLDLETQSSTLPQSQLSSKSEYYPTNYPEELRQHDAQFRILFSDVPREEIVLLVFRATWKPNDVQEFPGRAFVTSAAVYFYSHYLGLVLVNKIQLRFITDVQVTPGKTSDLLQLHLREAEDLGPLSDEDIAVTTFLEPIWVLQRRLHYLVDLTAMETQPSLNEIIENLTQMENEPERSPTSDSWEEISLGEGLEDTISKPGSSLIGHRSIRQLVEKVTIETGISNQGSGMTTFNFIPPANTAKVFSETFSLSAKSLFCLVFGNRSQVFHQLYAKRRSSKLICSPWVSSGTGIGERKLYYTNRHAFGQEDSQTIQAWEDNRYYIVLDERRPWMLPSTVTLTMETTIVISQISKSSANLSLWISLKWLRESRFWKDAIGAHAGRILQDDTQDLAAIITNEVNKIGNGTKLFKITGRYGQVTLDNDEVESQQTETIPHVSPSAMMPEATYWGLFIHDATSMAFKTTEAFGRWLLLGITWVFRFLRLNLIILILLGISIFLNFVMSIGAITELWHDSTALSYVRSIGVVPSMTMKRSITLQETELATSYNALRFDAREGQCFQKFLSMHAPLDDMDIGYQARSGFSNKLESARRKLGIYRHDVLVTLSLINSIERSFLLKEWDVWLWKEISRCRQARAAIRDSTFLADQPHDNISSSIDSYCSSCENSSAVDRAK